MPALIGYVFELSDGSKVTVTVGGRLAPHDVRSIEELLATVAPAKRVTCDRNAHVEAIAEIEAEYEAFVQGEPEFVGVAVTEEQQ